MATISRACPRCKKLIEVQVEQVGPDQTADAQTEINAKADADLNRLIEDCKLKDSQNVEPTQP